MSIDESTDCFGRSFAVNLVSCERDFPLLVIDRDVEMGEPPTPRGAYACNNDVLRLRFIANDRNIRA